MAVQVGNKQGPASSSLQPTPAPTKAVKSPEQTRSTSWGRESYGANGYNGRSDNDPGQRTRSDLTVNNDDTDPVLAAIRRDGHKIPNDQTRPMDTKQHVPTAWGNRNRNSEK